jgi:hypothetical protein
MRRAREEDEIGEVSFDYMSVFPPEDYYSTPNRGPCVSAPSPYSLQQQIELLRAGAKTFGAHSSTGRYLSRTADLLEGRRA